VLGAKVIGRDMELDNTRRTSGSPGKVLLSPATITSTPLLITLVARLYLASPIPFMFSPRPLTGTSAGNIQGFTK